MVLSRVISNVNSISRKQYFNTHIFSNVYFDITYVFRSWELNPTEGPNRVRIRLQRCHLNILKRFFKPEHSQKAG